MPRRASLRRAPSPARRPRPPPPPPRPPLPGTWRRPGPACPAAQARCPRGGRAAAVVSPAGPGAPQRRAGTAACPRLRLLHAALPGRVRRAGLPRRPSPPAAPGLPRGRRAAAAPHGGRAAASAPCRPGRAALICTRLEPAAVGAHRQLASVPRRGEASSPRGLQAGLPCLHACPTPGTTAPGPGHPLVSLAAAWCSAPSRRPGFSRTCSLSGLHLEDGPRRCCCCIPSSGLLCVASERGCRRVFGTSRVDCLYLPLCSV